MNRLSEANDSAGSDAGGLDWDQTEASTRTWLPQHPRSDSSARAAHGMREAPPPSDAIRNTRARSAPSAGSRTTQHGYAQRPAPAAEPESRSPRREPRTQTELPERVERENAREDDSAGWEERFRQQHAAIAEVEARQAAQGSAWAQKLARAAELKREAEEAAEAATWEKARLQASAQQAAQAAQLAARAAQQQEQARREHELAAQRSAEAAVREEERLRSAAAELASQESAHAEWQKQQTRLRQQLAARRAAHAAWEHAEARRLGELATRQAALAAIEHEEALKKQELAAQRATHAAWEEEQARLQLELAERQAAELSDPARLREAQELAAQQAEEAAAWESARNRALAAEQAEEAAAWESARGQALAAQQAEEAAAWESARGQALAAQQAEEAAAWESARLATQQAEDAAAWESAREQALAAAQHAEEAAAWEDRVRRQTLTGPAQVSAPARRTRTQSGVVARSTQPSRFDQPSPSLLSQTRSAGSTGRLMASASASAARIPSVARAELPDSLSPRSPQPMRKLGLVLAAAAIAVVAITSGVWIARNRSASVEVETQPADATVTIDGRPASGTNSPFKAPELKAGAHVLMVSKAGFVEQQVPFSVEAGAELRLPPVQLKKLEPKETGFSVESNPAGAQIWVDGRATGAITPARVVSLQPGSHSLRLELAGYASGEHNVFVPEAAVAALPRIDLQPLAPQPEPSKTRRSKHSRSSDDSDSSDDRSSAAKSSRHSRRAAADSDSGDDSAIAAKPSRHSRKAAADDAPAAEPPARAATGSGATGLLRLNSRPWSKVFVDGRFVGNTPQFDLKLSPGKHSVKLVNDDLGLSRTLSITLKAGETTTRVENLGD